VEPEELDAARELGVVGELPLFRPMPPFMAPADEEYDCEDGHLCSFLCLSFVISLMRSSSSWDSPGQKAKGELATCRHSADCGQQNRVKYTPP